MSLQQLIPILQLAIGPVILISGVGLILLSMTNRYGRVIDRSRLLVPMLDDPAASDHKQVVEQLRILWSRALYIRAGIAGGVLSVLLAATLIISLFVGEFFKLPITYFIVLCFSCCLASLITALVCFLLDVNLSLHALRLELPAEVRDQSLGKNPDPIAIGELRTEA